MDDININELKESIAEFHKYVKEIKETDEEYQGEADELIAALERTEAKMKSIQDQDQLQKEVGPFGWDMINILTAIHTLSDIEEEEFEVDFEEFDTSDE